MPPGIACQLCKARVSGCFFNFFQQIGSANDDTCLRSTEQFVPGKTDKIRPRGQGLLNGRFMTQTISGGVEQCAGTKIIDERHAIFMREFYYLSQIRALP